MNSNATVDHTNLDQYWNVIRKLDPELFLIKIALRETGINPMIVPNIIRSIGNLAYGTGFGKVQVIMQSRVITFIHGEESDRLDQDALVDPPEK